MRAYGQPPAEVSLRRWFASALTHALGCTYGSPAYESEELPGERRDRRGVLENCRTHNRASEVIHDHDFLGPLQDLQQVRPTKADVRVLRLVNDERWPPALLQTVHQGSGQRPQGTTSYTRVSFAEVRALRSGVPTPPNWAAPEVPLSFLQGAGVRTA